MSEKVINSGYGSIPHVSSSQSRSDKVIPEGQEKIATKEKRDDKDKIIVQEKFDGSNTGVLKKGNKIIPITRSGYEAISSYFHPWVLKRRKYFQQLLQSGERIMGEWILQAHGTKYHIYTKDSLWIPFDLIGENNKRVCFKEFHTRVEKNSYKKSYRPLLPFSQEGPVGIEESFDILMKFHRTGIDNYPKPKSKPEGIVYRVERNNEVDFLAKWVRPDKVDGKYLPNVEESVVDEPVWNTNNTKIT